MIEADPLRDAVAAHLAALSAPGHVLNTDSDRNTHTRYAADVRRAKFRKGVVAEYLERQSPVRDALSVVISAGAPGAGKSTALREHAADLNGYRILDADVIKDALIEQALTDGIYDDILARPLPDGRTVAPRELAGLVHHESTRLIDQIRGICIAQRENIVVEGTLSWKGQAPRLVAELAQGDYQRVEVIAIEADRATCHEQALTRWWRGRQQWAAGTDRLGGRFTPPAAIDICYSDTDLSRCAQHAVELGELAAETIDHTHVVVLRRTNTGALEPILELPHPDPTGS